MSAFSPACPGWRSTRRRARQPLVALELADFRFPPIQVGFVTLAQNETMAALDALRQALMEVAVTNGG